MGSPARAKSAAPRGRSEAGLRSRPRSAQRLAAAAGDGRLIWLTAAGAAAAILAFIARVAAPGLIDRPFSLSVNTLAQVSPTFDFAVGLLDRYALFQGVLILALGVGACVAADDKLQRLRLGLGGGGAAGAALLSRGVQMLMPHNPRPMFDPALAWTPPLHADTVTLADWSSFPSDHAAILFGLGLAVFLANRSLGACALAVACAMGLCRVYQGEHYLTDVIGGAALGMTGVGAATWAARSVAPALLAFVERHRVLTAVAATLFFVQAAVLFEDVRHIGTAVAKLLGHGEA